MAGTTTTARRLSTVSLQEDWRSRPRAVDEAAGVIRGVKVLGLYSDNGRRYLPEAVSRAAPFYEGIGVYLDHPPRPNQERSARDRIGWLENVQVTADGLYADLHLLTSDPATAKILEAARKRPDLFGLSHNAEGKGRQEGGVFVVEEITQVRSVDLVADPATNRSLFEGRSMPLTLKQLIEASKARPELKTKLLEMGAYEADDGAPLGDMPAPEPAAGQSPRDALVAAVAACLQSAEPGDHELALKVMKLLKPDERPTEEGDDDEPDANSAAQEGKKLKTTPGAEPLTEARALALIKASGLEASAELAEAIKGADLDRALAVLALAKRHAPPVHQSPPRSSGQRTAPVTEGVAPKDAAGWAVKLLG